MVQILMTIFFSAAALAALSVIVTMLADNAADIRHALGIGTAPSRLPAPAVRLRRATPSRTGLRASAVPLRAAA